MSTKKKGNVKNRVPLSKIEALDMLKSALWYCQQAGLDFAAGNLAGIATVQVKGALYVVDSRGWEFVPIDQVSALSAHPETTIGTPVDSVPLSAQ